MLHLGLALFLALKPLVPAAVTGALLPSVQSTTVAGLALTGTACTSLGSTDGISLAGVTSWRAIAVAPAGQTFTSGTAQCCVRAAVTGRWTQCDSRLNITLVSGQRDVPTPDFRALVGGSTRVAYLGSSITQSGGTTFSVAYEWVQQ